MPERLPWQERERLIDRAATDYMAGRIEADEYRRSCREHGPDYLAAARALAQMRSRKAPRDPARWRRWSWLWPWAE